MISVSYSSSQIKIEILSGNQMNERLRENEKEEETRTFFM